MPTFSQGSVVRVPFPYTDRPVRQYRPALVVSARTIGEADKFTWVLMITSAENRARPGDVPFGESYADAGLPAPSVVRTAKMATIESASAEEVGSVAADFLQRVMREVRHSLGL